MINRILLSILFILNAYLLHAQELSDDDVIQLTEVSKDPTYGYKSNNPVKAGSIPNSYRFLSALRGPGGEILQYTRIPSCCPFRTSNVAIKNRVLLDRYEVLYEGLNEPLVLYINVHEYVPMKCPQGLSSIHAGQNTGETVSLPAPDSIPLCNPDTIYSVDYFLLVEKGGIRRNKSYKPPYFEGGIEALAPYFSDKELKDRRAEHLSFPVSIGFIVNCKGEAGNFQLLTKGQDAILELSEQVLDIVKRMPQQWKPATINDQPVDSYQAISFTMLRRKFTRVHYQEK